MKKYKVYGTCEVTVTKEVWANNEDEALELVDNELDSLTEYIGNGGEDKLVGVSGKDESVSSDGYIIWNNAEVIEDNPDYHECPDCHEELVKYIGCNKKHFFKCEYCDSCYDEDGNEVDPFDYFEKEND